MRGLTCGGFLWGPKAYSIFLSIPWGYKMSWYALLAQPLFSLPVRALWHGWPEEEDAEIVLYFCGFAWCNLNHFIQTFLNASSHENSFRGRVIFLTYDCHVSKQKTLHVVNPKQETMVHIMFSYEFQTPSWLNERAIMWSVCENLWWWDIPVWFWLAVWTHALCSLCLGHSGLSAARNATGTHSSAAPAFSYQSLSCGPTFDQMPRQFSQQSDDSPHS